MKFDRQQIFDQALAHLRKQRRPAVNPNTDAPILCLYRAPNGCACAIGGLIPDDRYDPSLEGKSASHPDVVRALGYDLRELSPQDEEFLCNLQHQVHDLPSDSSNFLPAVEDSAGQFAEVWGLTYA